MIKIICPLALFVFLMVNIPYGNAFEEGGQDDSYEWAAQKILGEKFVGKVNRQLSSPRKLQKSAKRSNKIDRERKVESVKNTTPSHENDSKLSESSEKRLEHLENK